MWAWVGGEVFVELDVRGGEFELSVLSGEFVEEREGGEGREGRDGESLRGLSMSAEEKGCEGGLMLDDDYMSGYEGRAMRSRMWEETCWNVQSRFQYHMIRYDLSKGLRAEQE